MNRFAFAAVLLLLPSAAGAGVSATMDSTASASPAPAGGSVMSEPAKSAASTMAATDTTRPPSRYAKPDSALMASLRKGGYLLVFRHGKTDWAERDTDLMNLANRDTQRNLSDAGRREMEEVGKAVAALELPIGEVSSSPLWRCRDTATLAFGHCDTTSALFLRGPEYRTVRVTMLSTPPPPGKDNVIVTQQDLVMPILGILRDELGEGEALIILPHGDGKFDVAAQIAPADWLRFAAAVGSKPAAVGSKKAPAGKAKTKRPATPKSK